MAVRERELSIRRLPAGRVQRERTTRVRSILRSLRVGAVGVRRVRLPLGLRPKSYQQRSVVKISYARNLVGTRWAAHGSYLAREGAAREGERGFGFNADREDLELDGTLRAWQQAGDPHVFKVIVSPEHGDRMDLFEHARKLVSAMEKDLDTRLEWAGIVHTNTAHPHIHLVIRGRDDLGDPLVIDREYISSGIRLRSRDLSTRELGVRWERDLLDAREQAVQRRAFTEIDRAILSQSGQDRAVTYETPARDHPARVQRRVQEMRRLHFLSELGLAEKTGARTWQVSEHLESALREAERTADIARTLANGRLLVSTPNAQLVLESLDRPGPVVTGRLVARGMDDRTAAGTPYLLIEGTDGMVHYVPLPQAPGRPWASRPAELGALVSIEARSNPERGGPPVVPFLTVEGRADSLDSTRPPLALDLEILRGVQAQGRLLGGSDTLVGFPAQWARLRSERGAMLQEAGVIETRANGSARVAADWSTRLDALRAGLDRDAAATDRSIPEGLVTVRTRSLRSIAVSDAAGSEVGLRLEQLGLREAPDAGAELVLVSRARERAREGVSLTRIGELDRRPTPDQGTERNVRGSAYAVERIDSMQLRAEPDRFGPLDALLARVGPVSELAGDGPAVRALVERQRLWQERGVEADREFEERARRWLDENVHTRNLETLEAAAQRLGRPVRKIRPIDGVELPGRVAGFAREASTPYVLVDTGREVRAFESARGDLEIGQQVSARALAVEGENRRGQQQLVWRIDDLEQRQLQLERQRGRER